MCDVLWPCDNGAEATTSFNTTFNSLVSSTSNYITKNSSSASSSVSAFQTAEVYIGGDMKPGCSIDVSQKINISSQTGVNLDKSSVSDLRAHIANDLTNSADQNATATSSTFGGSASTATNTNVTQNIQNIVNQTLTDETYASMTSEVLGQQDGLVKINGSCFGPIRIDQNFCANVLATNIVTQIAEQLGGMDSDTRTSTTVTQTSTAKTKGPFESFASMFESFGAVGAIICLICVLMSCGGAAFAAYMMFGSK